LSTICSVTHTEGPHHGTAKKRPVTGTHRHQTQPLLTLVHEKKSSNIPNRKKKKGTPNQLSQPGLFRLSRKKSNQQRPNKNNLSRDTDI